MRRLSRSGRATSSGWETIATWLARDLDRRRAHARGELPLGVRRDRLVVLRRRGTRTAATSTPARPSRRANADDASGCCTAYITRARVGSTSPAKWSTKSSSESQPKPRESVNEMRQRRRDRPLGEKCAERLALVEPERGDVDEADDVRRVRAERGDDLAAVGVSDDDRRAVLERRAPGAAGRRRRRARSAGTAAL